MFPKYPDPQSQKIYQTLIAILDGYILLPVEKVVEADGLVEIFRTFSAQDWQLFTRLAQAEGVASLVYVAVKDTPNLCVAFQPHALNALRATYYSTAAHNAMLFQALDAILKALDAAKIPVLILKGAVLARNLYPDPALRPMHDLDLLVRREHLAQVVDIIRGLGYQEETSIYFEVASWADQAANHHIRMRNGVSHEVVVELHWNLVAGDADKRTPPAHWFWQTAVPLNERETGLDNQQVYGLSPVANLLYLSAHHYLQHGLEKGLLIWLFDLNLLVSRYSRTMDWPELFDYATMLHWVDPLYLAMQFVSKNWGGEVPAGVLSALEMSSNTEVQQLMKARSRPRRNRILDTLQGLDTFDRRTRLQFIIALIFPSPAYMRRRYRPHPGWLWPVCYLYRWYDLSKNGLLTLIHSFRRRKKSDPRV